MLDDVLVVLKSLNFRFKLGVVGSVARGEETTSSDIDIFVDGDMLDLKEIELIKQTILLNFNRDCDVVQSKLAKEEDERLDALAESLGLGKNENSSYKNMLKEVVWCE